METTDSSWLTCRGGQRHGEERRNIVKTARVPVHKHCDMSQALMSKAYQLSQCHVKQMCFFPHPDNGPAGSRRTGTATVFVEVQDVNDNRPIFLQNSYETSVVESVPRGTSILQVENTIIQI